MDTGLKIGNCEVHVTLNINPGCDKYGNPIFPKETINFVDKENQALMQFDMLEFGLFISKLVQWQVKRHNEQL